MTQSLHLNDLLTEVAKRIAEVNQQPVSRVQACTEEWRTALGSFVDTSAALYELVSSPDYW